MATLTIRNLPEDVRDRLRIRAAHAGRSMEAEARAILAGALAETAPRASADELQALVAQLYGGEPLAGGVDGLIRDRRREVIQEVLEQGDDPELVFGEEFERICKEAGLTPASVRRAARRRAK
jgi:plasmid stability protein